jgi:cell division protein FtsN
VQFFKQWLPGSAAVGKITPDRTGPSNTINPGEAESGWSVIVGSFASKEDANKTRDTINNTLAGHDAKVSKNSPDGWVVNVGGQNLSWQMQLFSKSYIRWLIQRSNLNAV